MRYTRSLSKYIGSPSESPSYSFSQLSPRNPLWTHRTTVLPLSRPSTRYSNAWSAPSSASAVRLAKCVGGSHAVIVASSEEPRNCMRVVPPSRGSISFTPMNQASTPGPVAIAFHTSSGVAVDLDLVGQLERVCHLSAPLRRMSACVRRLARDVVLQAGVDGHDQSVVTATRSLLVVVLAYQRSDRSGQFLGEGRPVCRRGEPDLAVHRERGQALLGLGRAGDELAHVAHRPGRHRDQPPRRQPVRRAGGVGLHPVERRRRDHVGERRRSQHAFRHIALLPLFDELHEAVPLERLEVVVHVLAREAERAGQARRGAGLGQLGQQAAPHGVQGHLGCLGVFDHGHIDHEAMLPPTVSFVKIGEIFRREPEWPTAGGGL